MNEFRAALSDSAKDNITRHEAESRFAAQDEKFDRQRVDMRSMAEEIAQARGSGIGKNQLYGAAAVVASIVIAGLGILAAVLR